MMLVDIIQFAKDFGDLFGYLKRLVFWHLALNMGLYQFTKSGCAIPHLAQKLRVFSKGI